MKSKQSCVQVKESSEGKMSVKICDMINECDCKKPNCCTVSKGEEYSGA